MSAARLLLIGRNLSDTNLAICCSVKLSALPISIAADILFAKLSVMFDRTNCLVAK